MGIDSRNGGFRKRRFRIRCSGPRLRERFAPELRGDSNPQLREELAQGGMCRVNLGWLWEWMHLEREAPTWSLDRLASRNGSRLRQTESGELPVALLRMECRFPVAVRGLAANSETPSRGILRTAPSPLAIPAHAKHRIRERKEATSS